MWKEARGAEVVPGRISTQRAAVEAIIKLGIWIVGKNTARFLERPVQTLCRLPVADRIVGSTAQNGKAGANHNGMASVWIRFCDAKLRSLLWKTCKATAS